MEMWTDREPEKSRKNDRVAEEDVSDKIPAGSK